MPRALTEGDSTPTMTAIIQRRIERRIEQLGAELESRDVPQKWRDHTRRLIHEYAQFQLSLGLREQARSRSPLASDEPPLEIGLERLRSLEDERTGTVIDEKLKTYFRYQLKRWGADNFRDFPWRRTRDPYYTIVAETMLQRTRAENVVPVYLKFIERYPTILDLADADDDELADILHPLGFRARAGSLKRMALMVISRHGGRIPQMESQLLLLPGVGDYTARAVLANAHARPLAVIDVNVARILERFFGFRGAKDKGRDKFLRSIANVVAPKKKTGVWNLTLIDFGAMICTASNPRCHACPLKKKCEFYNRVRQLTLHSTVNVK